MTKNEIYLKLSDFKVGDIIEADLSNYSKAYPYINQHRKPCKIISFNKDFCIELVNIQFQNGSFGIFNIEYIYSSSKPFRFNNLFCEFKNL